MLLEVCEFIPKSGCGLLAMAPTPSWCRPMTSSGSASPRRRRTNEGSIDITPKADGRRRSPPSPIATSSGSGSRRRYRTGSFQAHFLVLLSGRALQKALLWYQAEEWDEDLGRFTFVADRKLPGKLSMGEKYIHEVIVPALASREGALDVPEAWHQHPTIPSW
jgi:hypothetical protein